MMKSVKLIDLIKNASNVYRTDYYIVVQRLIIRNHICLNNVVFSEDTFIKRTPERDVEYTSLFLNKQTLQGKRLPSSAYSRTYIN